MSWITQRDTESCKMLTNFLFLLLTVIKKVPYEVKVPVNKPYPVEVPKPYPVWKEVKVPYTVEKKIPYEVKVPVDKPYDVIVEKKYEVKVPYPVHTPYEGNSELHFYLKKSTNDLILLLNSHQEGPIHCRKTSSIQGRGPSPQTLHHPQRN